MHSYQEIAKDFQNNPEQRSAYDSTGSFVVLAGPGSGKTKVLTTKMARVLAEDIRDPRGVACITFSNACVDELKKRLYDLGLRPGRGTFLGTTHTFCLSQILVPFAHLTDCDLPQPFRVASSDVRTTTLQAAIDEVLDYEVFAPEFQPRLESYRREHSDRNAADWNDDPETQHVVLRYEELLHEQGLIDFDDLVLDGVRIVREQSWVRKALCAKFPVLFVDEYQDLGPLLHELVILLHQAGVRIFAVGDPDQSIYGFNGANPILISELAKAEGMQNTRLRLNYRSRQLILDQSIALLGEARDYERAKNPDGDDSDSEGTIEFVACEDIDEQATVTASVLISRILSLKEARNLGDIAVLYPAAWIGDKIAAAAEAEGYQYIRLDARAPYPRSPLNRWLESCAAWCSGGWSTGKPSLSEILQWWSIFVEERAERRQSIRERARLAKFLWTRRDPEVPLNVWLGDLFAEFLDEALQSDGREDDTAAFEKLRSACSEGGPLEDWSIEAFGGQHGSPNHLRLITLHQCKGLEFDAVVMIGLDEGVIPRGNNPSRRVESEARRVFYVGMTRARHEVYFAYSTEAPSRFVTQIADELRNR